MRMVTISSAVVNALMKPMDGWAFNAWYFRPRQFKEIFLGAMKVFRKGSTNDGVLRRHLLAVWLRCAFPAIAVVMLRRMFYSVILFPAVDTSIGLVAVWAAAGEVNGHHIASRRVTKPSLNNPLDIVALQLRCLRRPGEI
jgi:hypothetical protein